MKTTMKQLLWYLIAGTRGGQTRGQIISALLQRPMNANRLAEALSLDYKTIQHHLSVLLQNGVLTVVNKGNYGAVYFVSELMDKKLFGEIWERFGKS